MYDIITIGDLVNDIFIKPHQAHFHDAHIGLDKDRLWLRHGDKISVDEVYRDVGGGAANVAVGLSHLGLNTSVIGVLGNDRGAEIIKERLEKESIGYQKTKTYKGDTSFSVIIVFKGERTIFVYRGFKDYSKITIPKTISTKWIYLGPVAKEFAINYSTLISLASEKNIKLAINPGHRQIEEGKDSLLRLLRVSSLLILNRREAIDLTRSSDYIEAKKLLIVLASYGPKIVVVTDGQNGAYVTDHNKYLHVPKCKAEVLDPTGAGDAFSSGFLASYIKDQEIEKALSWGIVNSAQVIEKYGAQTNLPKLSKLEKLVSFAPKLYKL